MGASRTSGGFGNRGGEEAGTRSSNTSNADGGPFAGKSKKKSGFGGMISRAMESNPKFKAAYEAKHPPAPTAPAPAAPASPAEASAAVPTANTSPITRVKQEKYKGKGRKSLLGG